jgi:hypothetical protein
VSARANIASAAWHTSIRTVGDARQERHRVTHRPQVSLRFIAKTQSIPGTGHGAGVADRRLARTHKSNTHLNPALVVSPLGPAQLGAGAGDWGCLAGQTRLYPTKPPRCLSNSFIFRVNKNNQQETKLETVTARPRNSGASLIAGLASHFGTTSTLTERCRCLPQAPRPCWPVGASATIGTSPRPTAG